MRKKGFTIIEILAVIMILSVIMIFAVPAIMNSAKDAKQATYMTKIRLIEAEAANHFFEEHFNDGEEKTITVAQLAEAGDLVYDNEALKIVEDPRGILSSLNKCVIKATKNNTTKKITAVLDEESCKTTN